METVARAFRMQQLQSDNPIHRSLTIPYAALASCTSMFLGIDVQYTTMVIFDKDLYQSLVVAVLEDAIEEDATDDANQLHNVPFILRDSTTPTESEIVVKELNLLAYAMDALRRRLQGAEYTPAVVAATAELGQDVLSILDWKKTILPVWVKQNLSLIVNELVVIPRPLSKDKWSEIIGTPTIPGYEVSTK